ncbi:predicted protein [Naegleria gruberi]|uniref:Transcriptional adapter n=1 Tax=Naegleria gruberi TaxID=5762 RepID=D2VY53_NAEGR|nr:uncharacterized protein NAEGRDRAFT_81671 [Naegleria gruberi]EFC38263.1 predicted protein [Naegleria gruberi]|eukprot:XP_002671007.1 predicted protein [Naegleria gruberi strain NEG-M]
MKRKHQATIVTPTPVEDDGHRVPDQHVTNYDIFEHYSKKAKNSIFQKDDLETDRFHCDYCKKDISSSLRIRCAECDEFDLCADCFFVGVETKEHKNDHAYRVMEYLQAPLLSTTWTADEELQLLEGISQKGLGNWLDIAEHIGKQKSKYECEYHYWTLYVDRPIAKRRALLEKIKTQKVVDDSTGSSSEDTEIYVPVPDTKAPIQNEKMNISKKDLKKDDDGIIWSVRKELSLPPVNMQTIFNENVKAHPECAKFVMGTLLSREPIIVGNRKNVQQLGQDIGYLPLRADFETDFDYCAEDIIAELEILPTDTPEEKEKKLDYLRLYEFRLSERERRKKFAVERGLFDWKRISAVEKKRNKMEKELYQRYRPFARFLDDQDEFDSFMAGVIQETKIRNRIQQLKEYRANGLTSLEQCDLFESENKKREADFDLKKAREGNIKSPSIKRNAEVITGTPKDPNMVGIEMLSKRERSFCVGLQLYPKHYILIKDVLIRESVQLGFVSKATACKLFTDFEKDVISKIHDFFVSNNWILGAPQATQEGSSGK